MLAGMVADLTRSLLTRIAFADCGWCLDVTCSTDGGAIGEHAGGVRRPRYRSHIAHGVVGIDAAVHGLRRSRCW